MSPVTTTGAPESPGPAGPSVQRRPLPVARSSTAGASGRVPNAVARSSSSTTVTGCGMSANESPAFRSTAWTQTSRARIHGTSDAGTVRPRAVRTRTSQHRAGSPAAAVAKRAPAACRSARASRLVRRVPASISAARWSVLAYIGFSSPVRAQVSRFTRASALRATWAITCERVQPGRQDGSRSGARPAAASKASVPCATHPSRTSTRVPGAATRVMSAP